MEKLLVSLREEDIHISLKGNDLKIKFDGDNISKEILESIKANKTELVEYLRKHQKSTSSIALLEKSQSGYPLSPAQESMWVLCQLDDASVAYNMPYSRRIMIKNVPKFMKSIDAVIERHEALRTVFRSNDEGELRQWILDAETVHFQIDTIDMRKCDEKEEAIKMFVKKDSEQCFDFSNGPLIRASLLRLDEEEYVFYYNLHHIICDGWSLDVIAKDVMAYYDRYLIQDEASLPSLSVQYKEYASWQLGQLEKEGFNKQKEFWLSKLQGNIPVLNLPTNKERPPVKTFNGYNIGTVIPGETVSKMSSLIEQYGGSLFLVLLAGLKAILYKYTNEKDIVVGTPVSGRNHQDLKDQIGFYLNILVLKTGIDPEENFEQFYARLKSEMILAFENQDYPFYNLVKDLSLHRDVSRSSVFDVLVDYHGISESVFTSGDGVISNGNSIAKYDLEFHFFEVDDTIEVSLNYNTDVYELVLMKQLLEHFNKFLEQIKDLTSIDQINILNSPELRTLETQSKGEEVQLEYFNIIECFQNQVVQYSKKEVLRFDDKTMSYSELDKLSNQIAFGLTNHYDVCPSDVIGIYFENNYWTVALLLGILKAGGTFLYLDTSLPKERKDFILEDAKAKLLVTTTNHLFELSDFSIPIFSIDVEFDQAWEDNLINNISRSSIAYLIYTSGSTGNPKGVKINHKSLSNYLQWAGKYYSDGGSENLNFGLFTTLAFDLTITSLFLPLCTGNTLTLLEPNSIDQKLKKYFESTINCIKLTPAHVNLLPSLAIEQTNVDMAIVGGDILYDYHVDILRSINPNMKIYNEYGPTEATIGCIVHPVSETKKESRIPIGRPIDNTVVLICNESMNYQPIGVEGEIYLGGESLAEGYNNRKELNQEKFITKSGKRLYKTGDIGKWMENGDIMYVGRKDDQFKIRGFRVEIDDITTNLLAKPSIEKVTVLVQENSKQEKDIVVYFVSDKKETISSLQEFLSFRLPKYMIPSSYIQLESIPLTNNGKVDKKKLLAMNTSAVSTGIAYVAPKDEMEIKLTEIWQEILQKEKVGMRDDFFVLGGNSLLVVRLINAYFNEFGVKLSMRDIFAKNLIQDHKDLLMVQEDQKKNHIETIEF